MILYFTDRRFDILGHASTSLPEGLIVVDDLKTEDIETGIATFECRIPFDSKTRKNVKACTEAGNFILRSHNDKNEYFTIIDTEWNEKDREVYIYAEDAGLDLLNEIVGGYVADEAKPISFYIEKFAYDSGFVIGTNEISSLTRKLSWDSAETATARLASVAKQFDNAEISYSFDVKGLKVVKKYINIHKKRGNDIGVQLRMNKEIDNIITTKSVANIATALRVTGGVPEDAEGAITLDGEKYDDGDIYLEGTYLKTRKANAIWSRYITEKGTDEGYIVKRFEYDTTSKSELLNRAIAELKKVREVEVNYEIDITSLPENVRIGDRVNIIDDNNELYVSSRILVLETSVSNETQTATIGEYLIKESGISQKVAELAKEFSEKSASAEYAKTIAKQAKEIATSAQAQANQALTDASNADSKADDAIHAANNAQQAANNAGTLASDAQTAVENVEKAVESIETSVSNAQAAAEQARKAAQTAETKATEAHSASVKAKEDAEEAKTASDEAKTQASNAQTKADNAVSVAEQAVADAEEASTIAAAAKLDSEQAKADIEEFAENLTTIENTMKADYARKTELTEATASLQTQITQNANEITSTASRVTTMNETVNNAQTMAQSAQTKAEAAQAQADKATADAEAAQSAADTATQAAVNAQSEADKAKQAAATAQGIADKAEEDLAKAQADLATVQSRVDATEEDIVKAQTAVNTAQAAADKAKADALEAAQKAATAQSTADTAVTNAENAQAKADEADAKATIAQTIANEAKGNAAAAQATADQAKEAAQAAQSTADTAKANATTAQNKANEAAQAALLAQQAADEADAKAAQAEADLATAQQNLANVTSRVGATEEEIAQAQADVATAQAAADKAKSDAATAQSTADTAKANAATAQQAANQAKTAADNAQKAADDAKEAADKAQADVDALTIRVTTAETQITQNSEQIALRATKTEVATTLGGYYTKEEADAAISVKANEITSTVAQTYTEKRTSVKEVKQYYADSSNFGDTLSCNVEVTDGVDVLGFGVLFVFVSSSTPTPEDFQRGGKLVIDPDVGSDALDKFEESSVPLVAKNMSDEYGINGYLYAFGLSVFGQMLLSHIVAVLNEDFNGFSKGTYVMCGIQNISSGAIENTDLYYSIQLEGYTGFGGTVPKPTEYPPTGWDEVEPTNATGSIYTTLCTVYGDNSFVYSEPCLNNAFDVAKTAAEQASAANAEVASLETRVSQTESSITSQASAIDGLGSRMSTVEQTADGLSVSLQTTNNNVTTAQNTANTAKTNATNAAKTATNFLSYDSTNGLLVGNKSSGSWSGYRTQVKSDSFNILDASGNALATYGANKIELGKNSTDSSIELCGGKGTIVYGGGYNLSDTLGIRSDAVQLYSSGNITWSDRNTYYSEGGVDVAAVADYDSHRSRLFSVLKTSSTGTYEKGASIEAIPNVITLEVWDGGDLRSNMWLNPNYSILTSPEYILLDTGYVTVDGDLAASGDLEVAGAINGANAKLSWMVLRAQKPYLDFYGNNATSSFTHRIISEGTVFGIYDYAGGGIDITTPASIKLAGGGTGGTSYIAILGDRMRSTVNNAYYLGDATYKWKAVYAVNGTIQTSDRNAKENIEEIDERYVALFDKLKPVTFEFTGNEHDRVHIGFISQDVKESMDEVGLTDLDFAGYCRDIKTEYDEETDSDVEVLDENGEPVYSYSLRYSEFIALNSKMIQMNKQKIAEQEKEIADLKTEVSELKELVKQLLNQ